MDASAARVDVWPIWAKVIVIMLALLAILIALPWIFMSSTMAAQCLPMMDGMRQMMAPGMMR
jgi:hypothetical protein